MSVFLTFLPGHDSTAATNVRRFIAQCRDELKVYGALNFDADIWPVGTSLNTDNTRGTDNLYFCTLATASRGGEKAPLHVEYAGFAKAYVRYMHGIDPVGRTATANRMRALQAVEQALLESGTACPTKINSTVLNRAAAIIKERKFSVAGDYQVGSALNRLARFLDENRLTRVACNWHSYLSVPSDFRVKVGPEYEERRNSKLPLQEHIEALGTAFFKAAKSRDVLASSVLAILLCQPGRIIEVLLLPVDCLVPREDGKRGFLLRYRPAKGGTAVLKPVSATMSDVAEEAVSRLKQLSAPARLIAEHYESYPNTIYLEDGLSHLREKNMISAREAGEILWGKSFRMYGRSEQPADETKMLASVLTWCKTNKVKIELDARISGDRLIKAIDIPRIRFADLEHTVVQMLPPGFPIFHQMSGLKYSEALCVSRVHEFGFVKKILVCMIRPIGKHEITKAVNEDLDTGVPSLFESTGVRDSKGRPIKIASHQLRHFLNTIAQAANMDEFDIAAWSGRKNFSQNAAYDHVSSSERVEDMRISVERATSTFAPPAVKKAYIPILRSEWLSKRVRAGHTTDIGHCVHDFVMAPCQKFGDHINCEENVIIKGEVEVENRIRMSLQENQGLYDSALAAMRNGNASAENWLESHSARLARFKEIVQILDDPGVEQGAMIRLSIPDSPSRLSDASRLRRLAENDMGVREGEVPHLQVSVTSSVRAPSESALEEHDNVTVEEKLNHPGDSELNSIRRARRGRRNG